MSQLAEIVLTSLLATTLYVAAGTLVVAGVVRWLRATSPGVQRLAWTAVLLLGWLHLPVSIAIPWYEPIDESPTRATVGLPPGYAPTSVGAAASVGSIPVDIAKESEATVDDVGATDTTMATPLPPTAGVHWQVILAAAWLLGISAIVCTFAARYWRLTRLLSRGCTGDAAWQREWDAVLSRAGVRRTIPLCVTGEFGPALCRLPRGFALFVPAQLWRGLDAAQREAILTHELAHYRRGDVYKSLAARLAALPHWFNPLAWYASGRFEEAGEWACDEAVRRAAPDHVTRYAQALLSLGEVTGETHALSTAARGRELPIRVRRLLASPVEDSMMKKLIVSGVAVLIVLICAVRFELIAQEADDKPAVINEVAVKHAEAMVDAAQKTLEAVKQEYEIGRRVMDDVYVWSRRWLDAEQLLAGLKFRGNAERLEAERTVAFDMHLKRMEELHARVKALFEQGAQGGEFGRLRATEFFVAEAKLWAEGEIGVPAVENATLRATREPAEGNGNSGLLQPVMTESYAIFPVTTQLQKALTAGLPGHRAEDARACMLVNGRPLVLADSSIDPSKLDVHGIRRDLIPFARSKGRLYIRTLYGDAPPSEADDVLMFSFSGIGRWSGFSDTKSASSFGVSWSEVLESIGDEFEVDVDEPPSAIDGVIVYPVRTVLSKLLLDRHDAACVVDVLTPFEGSTNADDLETIWQVTEQALAKAQVERRGTLQLRITSKGDDGQRKAEGVEWDNLARRFGFTAGRYSLTPFRD